MKVHDLTPAPGSTRARRRVGRGIAGNGGKTAGRGTKGQGARDNIKPGFEGGQQLLRRAMHPMKIAVQFLAQRLVLQGGMPVASRKDRMNENVRERLGHGDRLGEETEGFNPYRVGLPRWPVPG